MRISVLVLLIIMLLQSCNCQRAQSLSIGRVLVDRFDGAQNLALDRDQLHALVEQEVKKHALTRLDLGKESGAILRVQIGQLGALDTAQSELRIGVVLQDAQGLEISQTETQLELSGTQLAERFSSLVQESLTQLEKNTRGLAPLSGAELREMLKNGVKNEQRIAIIEELGARKDAMSIEILGEILVKEELATASAALLVLMEIGDERAMPYVIEYAERKSPQVRQQAIYAAKSLGGKLAAAWLFTLSTGHENAEVRDAARLALSHVESKLSEDS